MARGKRKKKPEPTRSLTDEQEAEAVARFLGGESDADIAQAFGVHKNTIANMRKRRGVKAKHRHVGVGAANVGTDRKPEPREDLLAEYDDLGEVPDDPIMAMAWGRRALLCMARQVMLDRKYAGSEAQRRREVKDLIKAAAALKDEDALADALEQLRLDAEGMDYQGARLQDVDPTRKRRRAHLAAPS